MHTSLRAALSKKRREQHEQRIHNDETAGNFRPGLDPDFRILAGRHGACGHRAGPAAHDVRIPRRPARSRADCTFGHSASTLRCLACGTHWHSGRPCWQPSAAPAWACCIRIQRYRTFMDSDPAGDCSIASRSGRLRGIGPDVQHSPSGTILQRGQPGKVVCAADRLCEHRCHWNYGIKRVSWRQELAHTVPRLCNQFTAGAAGLQPYPRPTAQPKPRRPRCGDVRACSARGGRDCVSLATPDRHLCADFFCQHRPSTWL